MYRTTDHLLGLQPGQRERSATAVDDPPVPVAREEGRVGRRVVVVEQFVQIGKAALLAPARLAPEAGVAVGSHRPVAAMRTDEVVLVTHAQWRRVRQPWALGVKALMTEPAL